MLKNARPSTAGPTGKSPTGEVRGWTLQQHLFDVSSKHLKARSRFHNVAVESESLIGMPLCGIADHRKIYDTKERITIMSHEPNGSSRKRRWIVVPLLIVVTIGITAIFVTRNRDAQASDSQPVAHKHDNAGDTCYLCDPSLRDKGRLWCKEHNRYEDRCWACHPELQDKSRPFCKEHGLYEDECLFCNPGLKRTVDDTQGGSSSARPTLFCNEHRVPETQCGICQPQLASTLKPGQSMMVRFESTQSLVKAGIRTALPTSSSSSPTAAAFCRVGYNENAFARISPLVSGVIRRVLVDVGAEVKEGSVLLEMTSIEIAEAKAAYLAAIADYRVKDIACNRADRLVKGRISAAREYEEAKANRDIALLARNTARQRLLNYGFAGTEIKKIENTQDSSALYTVRAPFGGTVVLRKAVLGEAAEPGQALLALADLTTLWLELSIPVEQVAFIEKGLDVEAAFDCLPSVSVKGKLSWVATSIDDRSRMLKARAVIPNERGVLKSGMFGKAHITLESVVSSLRVPKDAVQRFEGNPYLFVKEDEDLYALRRVVLGNKTDADIDVIVGIGENDRVVAVGTFTVMSEYLKSRLGAGCVDD